MTAPLPTAAPASPRVRLACTALDAALAVPGVVAADAGPHGLHLTASGTTVVRGVRVAAEPGGRYGVDLGLRARLVALPALADAVRERVTRSAALAGLAEQLGAIAVTFHGVLDDAEVAQLAAARAADALAEATL